VILLNLFMQIPGRDDRFQPHPFRFIIPLIILSFDAIQSELLKSMLNKQIIFVT
jgi:hypothetical protein